MRVLAIETATATGSIALLEGPTLVAERTEAIPMHHLEWLVPSIQRVLAEVGWQMETIEGIGVSQGPGSFMGVRIGIATASAWAKARRIPVVGVPTLGALAMGVDAHGWICPILDVRRGDVAAALFRRDGALVRISEDVVAPVETVLGQLPPEPVLTFAGDGLERYGPAIQAARGDRATLAPRGQWVPRARAIGRLAWERLARGEGDDPYELLPIYSRHPVLEAHPWPSAKVTGSPSSEW